MVAAHHGFLTIRIDDPDPGFTNYVTTGRNRLYFPDAGTDLVQDGSHAMEDASASRLHSLILMMRRSDPAGRIRHNGQPPENDQQGEQK
jgi:hypothetical protein